MNDGSTAAWIDENLPEIQAIAGLKQEIIDQNAQASGIREKVGTESMLDEALGYLAMAQLTTHENLQSAMANVPYEGILHRYEHALRWGAALALRLERVNAGDPEGAAQIRSDEEILREYIPALAARWQEIAAAEVDKLREHERKNVIGEQAAAARVQAKIEDILQVVGVMPIPELLTPAQRMGRTALISESELVEVDIFPSGKESRNRQEEIVAHVQRRYNGRTPGASEFLALILAEVPREAWTAEALAHFIYDVNDEDPVKYQTRVSALISNYEKVLNPERTAGGKQKAVLIIGKVLEKEGLAFQRGRRIRIDRATGRQIGQAKVIFRAVPIEEAGKPERIVRNDNGVEYVDDDWQSVLLPGDAS